MGNNYSYRQVDPETASKSKYDIAHESLTFSKASLFFQVIIFCSVIAGLFLWSFNLVETRNLRNDMDDLEMETLMRVMDSQNYVVYDDHDIRTNLTLLKSLLTNETSGTFPLGFEPQKIVIVRDLLGWYFENQGANQTIAIVVPFHHPQIETQLTKFSELHDVGNCTIDSGCLKIEQVGKPKLPNKKYIHWVIEAALGIQMVHAILPLANKIVVECSSPYPADMYECTKRAGQLSHYVVMSFGANENRIDKPLLFKFNNLFEDYTNVSFFAAAGDTRGIVYFPSSSPYVVSIGGTALYNNTLDPVEIAWQETSGGCSAIFPANVNQTTYLQNQSVEWFYYCRGRRAIPDLSFVADPVTGVYVYVDISLWTGNKDDKGWLIVGGTSVGAASIASYYAGLNTTANAANMYFNEKPDTRDIIYGAYNPPVSFGYDLYTGLGTPIMVPG